MAKMRKISINQKFKILENSQLNLMKSIEYLHNYMIAVDKLMGHFKKEFPHIFEAFNAEIKKQSEAEARKNPDETKN